MKVLVLWISFALTSISLSQAQFDSDFSKQWYLGYQKNGLGVDAVNAWKITKGSEKIVVAVIDTGVDANHPELKGQMWVNTKEIPGNNIDDDKNGYIDDINGYNFVGKNGNSLDDHGHGTHVAGIIGAAHNGVGTMGIMAKVRIMAVKVLSRSGSGADDAIANGIKYAINNGADVINMSLGGPVKSELYFKSLELAQAKDVVVVISAGNNGNTVPMYPASYELSNIISVASVDAKNIKSDFSSYGKKNVHIFSPGSDIYSLKMGGGYISMDGTSMAAPVISGIAGLVLAYHGKKAAKNMRERLMYTSRKLKRLDGFVTSNGVVSASSALTGQMSLDILLD